MVHLLALAANDSAQVARVAILRGRDYATIRREYHDNIYGAVVGYLDSSLPVTRYRNLAKRAIDRLFPAAFQAGYEESSGEETLDKDDAVWIAARAEAEGEFIDDLFASLKELRAGGDFDADAVATRHADGYSATLDGIYSEGRLRGAGNRVFEFGGESGKESCGTCVGLMGKRLRARTIVKRGLIPAPGNRVFECGGWRCEHFWFDPKTGDRLTQ